MFNDKCTISITSAAADNSNAIKVIYAKHLKTKRKYEDILKRQFL